MKRTTLLCLVLLSLLNACKKDDDTGTSGLITNTKTTVSPPAGFPFPYTYYQRGNTVEFKMWVKGADVSSRNQVEKIFPSSTNSFVFQLRLLNHKDVEILASDMSVLSTSQYFFTKDSLYLYDVDASDTIAIAKGNYQGFTLSQTDYMICGTDGIHTMDISRVYSRGHLGVSTYNEIASIGSFYNIRQIDTLAYYNSTISFK